MPPPPSLKTGITKAFDKTSLDGKTAPQVAYQKPTLENTVPSIRRQVCQISLVFPCGLVCSLFPLVQLSSATAKTDPDSDPDFSTDMLATDPSGSMQESKVGSLLFISCCCLTVIWWSG